MIILESVATTGKAEWQCAELAMYIAKMLEVGVMQQAIQCGVAVNSKPGSLITDSTKFITRLDWFLDTTRLLKPMGILVNPFLHHQYRCLVPELGGEGGWLLNHAEWVTWYRSCLACPALMVLIYASGLDPDIAGSCSNGLYYDRMVHYDATIDLGICNPIEENNFGDIVSALLAQHDLLMQRAAYERAVKYYPAPMPRG